jgi:pyrroline-5-carboxylate reductase
MNTLKDKRIAIIGLGKMGGMLASALLNKNAVTPDFICGTTRQEVSAQRAHKAYGLNVITDNIKAVSDSDVVILAVKPQTMPNVLEELKPVIKPNQVVVSLAAATETSSIEAGLAEDVPVIRSMPNLPCLIGKGMTVLCPGKHVTDDQLALTQAIFEAVGRVAVIDRDDLMDAVTALSGSGPAYAYIMIESMAEGGVKVGLPRSLATTLAAQTMLGAAAMVLETGQHPAQLKDMVTTPAGTTVDGIMALEEGGLRVALIKAIDAATAKAKDIS